MPVLEALQSLEEVIWLIVRRALAEEDAEALEALIPQIRDRYRGQAEVSSTGQLDARDHLPRIDSGSGAAFRG